MKCIWLLALFVCQLTIRSQELYPNSEPASITPKNSLGIRLMNEGYTSNKYFKSWQGAMLMYGLNSKLMVTSMLTTSNHHRKNLPANFAQTDTTLKQSSASENSKENDYLFESINFGFRYRFLNHDGDHKHFRMALYGNGVYSFRPHDEAEVTLMGDNKGIGGGFISTILINKLAISLTGGVIAPFSHHDKKTNFTLRYGNAYNYSLSFGYLVYPFKYKNFKQTNINLYVEFIGKNYSELNLSKGQSNITLPSNNAFDGNNYIEIRPAIQFIVKSNLRIDCSTALPLIRQSYIRSYPVFLLNFQYYFFL